MRAFINAKFENKKETAFILGQENTFTCFGTNEEILSHVARQDEIIDANGGLVVPGFVDGHRQLLLEGFFAHVPSLRTCQNTEDILARLRGAVETAKDWVLVKDYDECILTGKPLDKYILDGISREMPIAVFFASHHRAIVNSKALQLAKIEEDSIIEGGRIDFFKGLLEESALNVLRQALPVCSEETIQKALIKGTQECVRLGVTTVGSQDFSSVNADYKTVLDVYMKLAYQNKLPLRICQQCSFANPEDFVEFLEAGYSTGVCQGNFLIGPLVIQADSYDGKYPVYNKGEIQTLLEASNYYNMPTLIEVHNEKTMRMILELYAPFLLPNNPLGYGIYCDFLPGDELLKNLAQQQIHLYTNQPVNSPTHIYTSSQSDRNYLKFSNDKAIKLLGFDEVQQEMKEGCLANFVIINAQTKQVSMSVVDGETVYKK